MDENNGGSQISRAKLEANRRNAQRSTGPKSDLGKQRSRSNALRHGILSSDLLIKGGNGAENAAQYDELMDTLRSDLAPEGALEEILVEKIAICLWRLKRALRCEAGVVKRQNMPSMSSELERLSLMATGQLEESSDIREDLSLPDVISLNKILRYETAVHRQLAYAINQLERLQRARKGETLPAPISVQLSRDE